MKGVEGLSFHKNENLFKVVISSPSMEKPNRDRVLDHWYDQDVLTVDGIIVIHDEIIELYGGFSGVMKRGELEFVVDQVNYEKKMFTGTRF